MPSDILLRCIICPKTPRFSDVSHLLTHVSSKGHLSHYFKLQVRSHEEPEAVDTLADYNDWYEKYNLAGLLSERMRAKDARKGRGHSSLGAGDIKRERRASTAARRSSAPEAGATSMGNLTTVVTNNVKVPSRQLVVDPCLSQSYPSVSNSNVQTYPPPSLQMGPPPGTSSFQVKGTMSHSFNQAPPAWPLAPQQPQLPSLGRWEREPSPEDNDDQASPLAQRSGLRRSARRAKKLVTRRARRAASPDPFVDDDASFEQDEEDDEDMSAERLDEMTRLKGILWPGMDLFDAATEQMRRKRNQKKDASVLKQMEKASEDVEPTEMVFSPFGTLRRERFIDGNVDETDLLPGETPLPKTRPPRRKRPAPPPPSINPSFKTLGRQQGRRPNTAQDSSLLESQMDPQPKYDFGNYVSPDSSDYSFTYGDQAQRTSNGFAIFNDENKEYNIPRSGDALEDVKNFGRDNSNYPANFGVIDQLKDYLDSKHQTRTTAFPPGKENIDPVLSQPGRVDIRTGSTSWGGQQHSAASPQYSSHYTYGSGCPPGYVPFGDHDAFGYPYNPLFQGFSQSANGKEFTASNDLFLSPDCKGVKEEHGPGDVSPDETVSDMDREDVSRLYLGTVSG